MHLFRSLCVKREGIALPNDEQGLSLVVVVVVVQWMGTSKDCLYRIKVNSKLLKQVSNDVTITRTFKGTASFKIREIDPSPVKETSFTCSLVINWIQKRCL